MESKITEPNSNLEAEMLKLEIKKLEEPWYKKHKYHSLLVTLIILATSAAWTIKSGILDVKSEKLENQKILLQIEIESFTNKRDSLHIKVNQLYYNIKYLKDSLTYNSQKLAESLSKEKVLRESLTRNMSTREELIVYYESVIDSLINYQRKIESSVGTPLTDEDGNFLLFEDGTRVMNDDTYFKDKSGNPILDKSGNPISTK